MQTQFEARSTYGSYSIAREAAALVLASNPVSDLTRPALAVHVEHSDAANDGSNTGSELWTDHVAESAARRAFGSSHGQIAEALGASARIAIECIANSDALYHNLEHTMLVALAGHDILRGRGLREAIGPSDWAHFLVACLMHDIGYVRGVLKDDDTDAFVIDARGRKVRLPRGASDAALAPYHVDRSKLFVQERLARSELLDAERIARMIEFTRFPAPEGRNDAELRTCNGDERTRNSASVRPVWEDGR